MRQRWQCNPSRDKNHPGSPAPLTCGLAAESHGNHRLQRPVLDLRGSNSTEDMNLGIAAGAVKDGRNKPSEAEFGNASPLFCAMQPRRERTRYFAHLGEITGIFEGDADLLWANSGNKPNGTAYSMKPVTRLFHCHAMWLVRYSRQASTCEPIAGSSLPAHA